MLNSLITFDTFSNSISIQKLYSSHSWHCIFFSGPAPPYNMHSNYFYFYFFYCVKLSDEFDGPLAEYGHDKLRLEKQACIAVSAIIIIDQEWAHSTLGRVVQRKTSLMLTALT